MGRDEAMSLEGKVMIPEGMAMGLERRASVSAQNVSLLVGNQ